MCGEGEGVMIVLFGNTEGCWIRACANGILHIHFSNFTEQLTTREGKTNTYHSHCNKISMGINVN